MEREHKFRAKEINFGDWVYGHLIKNSVATRIIGNHNIYWQDEQKQFHKVEADIWTVDEKTVGELTGLKDKKGKDIYTSDLMRINDNEFVGEVAWDNEKGYYCFWNLGGRPNLVRHIEEGYYVIGDMFTSDGN